MIGENKENDVFYSDEDIEKMQRAEAEVNFEDDFFDDDMDEEQEILGYHCLGCGNIQQGSSGFGCDRCLGHCLDPWYG